MVAIRRYILGLFLMFVCMVSVKSQALWEIGGRGGTAFYLGDMNTTIFNEFQPAGAFYIRHNFNPHYSLTGMFGGGEITAPMERTFVDATLQVEFNFYEFGLMNSSSWTKYFSPYIFTGFSTAAYNSIQQSAILAPNLPFGLGVKCKVYRIVNVGLEWSMHKLFNDKFDFVDDPYGINASGSVNNDWYSTLTLFVGIDWGKRNRFCR